MTTTDNSRYLTILNSDKTVPPPIIHNLGDKSKNDYIKRKQLLFKGIEKILQNEENILILNYNTKNSN